jgi:acetyl-CoA carboxylase carboxyltransferase component
MGKVEEKIKALKEKEAKALEMGGEKLVAKQKEKGKLTARERMARLFDKGTFREIDMFVKHRCSNFNMAETPIPSDGVITGHGLVDGRPVFAFAPVSRKAWTPCAGTATFFIAIPWLRASSPSSRPSWAPRPVAPFTPRP